MGDASPALRERFARGGVSWSRARPRRWATASSAAATPRRRRTLSSTRSRARCNRSAPRWPTWSARASMSGTSPTGRPSPGCTARASVRFSRPTRWSAPHLSATSIWWRWRRRPRSASASSAYSALALFAQSRCTHLVLALRRRRAVFDAAVNRNGDAGEGAGDAHRDQEFRALAHAGLRQRRGLRLQRGLVALAMAVLS